jgi:hypothetical protein
MFYALRHNSLVNTRNFISKIYKFCLPFQTATGVAAAVPDKREAGGKTIPPDRRTT